jgi:hypothetical protein
VRPETRRLAAWLSCKATPLEDVFRESAGGRPVALLPDVAAALADLPQERTAWSAASWGALALATERCRWGHVHAPPPTLEDASGAELLYQRCAALVACGWRAIYPLAVARGNTCELRPSTDLLLGRGDEGREEVLIVDLDCRDDRPPQRHVGAALALAAMGHLTVSVLLAQRGRRLRLYADKAYASALAAEAWPTFFGSQ